MISPHHARAFIRCAPLLLAAACGGEPFPGEDPFATPDAGSATPPGQKADAGTAPLGPNAGASPDASRARLPENAGTAPAPPGVYAIDTLDFNDPAPIPGLRAIVGDASVVAVGETIHFSMGYARARALFIRKLIEDLGFRTIAFEGSWYSALKTNDYVHGNASLHEGINGLTFGAWTNRPTTQLLKWVREWNRTHADDVVIFGFDIQDPVGMGLTLRRVTSELETAGTVTASAATQRYDALTACPGAAARTYEEAFRTGPDKDILQLKVPLSPERFQACADMIQAYRQWFEGLDADLNPEQRVFVAAALRSLEAFNLEHFYFDDYHRSSAERDHGMADVFERLHAHFAPGQRVVNFAHNAHNRMRSDEIQGAYSFRSYGTWLAERMGRAYAPIGFFAAKVAWNWGIDHPMGEGEWVAESWIQSVESTIQRLNLSHALVDLERTTAPAGLFVEGEVYEHGLSHERSPPRDNYRAVFFMEESEAFDGRVL